MTTILRNGASWVALKPLGERTAKVEDGNVFVRGDLVELPPDLSWVEASQVLEKDRTAFDPRDLELTRDIVTGQTPREPHEDLSHALAVEDPQSAWRELEVELSLDNTDSIARALDNELARPAQKEEPALRPRKSDVA